MNAIELSREQTSAVRQIVSWIADSDEPRPRFCLGGYAGTGKSTILQTVLAKIDESWSDADGFSFEAAICAPTGKAASVLISKGLEAVTVHRLIYECYHMCVKCDLLMQTQICTSCGSNLSRRHFVRRAELDVDLIVIDEASMVSAELMKDIEAFGVPVLYVGDHAQLEPIGNDPGLMRMLDWRLEEIHRQAAHNPIILFAHDLRQKIHPLESKFSQDSVKILRRLPERFSDHYDVVLCGFNKTRVAVNARIRKELGFSGDRPCIGERVISLKNDSTLGLWNGLMGTVVAIDERTISLKSDDGGFYPQIPVLWEQFGAEKKIENVRKKMQFDFGYCLTTHKAQGSEWDRVLVLEQISDAWSKERWRYTAATRAAKELTWTIK